MGGNIYVIGGENNEKNNKLSSVEMFNTTTRQWTFLPSMGTERFGCAAVSLGGNIYVVGGENNEKNNKLSSVE
eukprot:7210224-Ditylum_brightwellii.AAC.1